MTRENLLEKVKEQKKRNLVVLEWATGTGKSFGALTLAKEWKPKTVLLVIAEITHRTNWLLEIEKFNSLKGSVFRDTELIIECYASLKNYVNTEWDMIILDECHHLSELRLEILSTLKCDKVVALSATLDEDDVDNLNYNLKINKSNTYHSIITLNQVIEWGILPKPDIYLIPLQLNEIDKTLTIIEEWGAKSKRKEIKCDYSEMWHYKRNKNKYPHTTLIISCTEREKCTYYENNIEYYKKLFFKNYQDYIKIKWMRLGNERKKFLGSLKDEYVKILVSKLKGLRFICYCSSIEQAERIGKEATIHSEISNKTNDEILERFQNKELNELYCIGKLTEGQNLVDIEAGIIVQLDGTIRPFTQKHGRVLRSENPLQFIFYYENTRDQEYLENILKGINTEYIQSISNLKKFTL